MTRNLLLGLLLFLGTICTDRYHLLAFDFNPVNNIQDSLKSNTGAKEAAFKKWIVDSATIVQQKLIQENPNYDSVAVFAGVDSENLNIQIRTTELIHNSHYEDSVTGMAMKMLGWNEVIIPKNCTIKTCFTLVYSISMFDEMLYEPSYEFCDISIKPKGRKTCLVYTLIKGNLTNGDTIQCNYR